MSITCRFGVGRPPSHWRASCSARWMFVKWSGRSISVMPGSDMSARRRTTGSWMVTGLGMMFGTSPGARRRATVYISTNCR